MPIPSRKKNEDTSKFAGRCMSDPKMVAEYPDEKQRYAVCMNKTKSSLLEQVCDIIEEKNLGSTEELTPFNFIIPEDSDYEDFGEETETVEVNSIASFIYKDTATEELFYFSTKANHYRDGTLLQFVSEAAEYQGKKVNLGKPFRTPDGPKKFSVYVKNDKGNVVKVNFGDPNMEIKKDNPARRRSFRARHNCDNPGPRWKARYWSCKKW